MKGNSTLAPGVAVILQTAGPSPARRSTLIASHPEIRRLGGPDRRTAWWCLALFTGQSGLAVLAGQVGWVTVLIAGYGFGPLLALAIYALVHESVHNLIFRRPVANRWIGLVTSLPNVVPSAATFRTFHLAHHAHLGEYRWDGDVPGRAERRLVGTAPGRKAIWLAGMWLVQIGRAIRITRIAIWDRWALLNIAVQASYLALIAELGGAKGLAYLVLSSIFSIGLHPLGARWIQEHFPLFAGQHTTSYYGPANRLAFNAGLHVEHHDLPYVAWHRLPELRRIAPEFYCELGSVRSWTGLLVRFLFDRSLTLSRRG